MISAIQNTQYSSPAASGRNIREAASGFSIPKSPLRTNPAEEMRNAAADPASDSVELSRTQPALLMGQIYSPPPPPPAGAAQEASTDREKTGFGLGGGRNPDSEEENADTAVAGQEEGDGDDEAVRAGRDTDIKGEPLDDTDQRQLDELQNRDVEVRQHEQTHKAVGGSYAGSISYEYQQGPDGKRYAVGGEVSIDVSTEKDPAATAAKMRQVRAAALAPAEPSAQDRSVAAEAMKKENEARQEVNQERAAGSGEAGQSGKTSDSENGTEGESGEGTASSSGISAAANTSRSGASQGAFSGASGMGGASAPASLSASYGASAARTSRLASAAFGYSPIDVFA